MIKLKECIYCMHIQYICTTMHLAHSTGYYECALYILNGKGYMHRRKLQRVTIASASGVFA